MVASKSEKMNASPVRNDIKLNIPAPGKSNALSSQVNKWYSIILLFTIYNLFLFFIKNIF